MGLMADHRHNRPARPARGALDLRRQRRRTMTVFGRITHRVLLILIVAPLLAAGRKQRAKGLF